MIIFEVLAADANAAASVTAAAAAAGRAVTAAAAAFSEQTLACARTSCGGFETTKKGRWRIFLSRQSKRIGNHCLRINQ